MSFLRLLSAWPLRNLSVLLGFSSGELEMCVCSSFLEVAQSIASGFDGKTDLKFE